MVICLEQGADLHTAQLMPLPLTVSCFAKIQIGVTFLVPAHLGSPGKRAVKRVCVCVCVYIIYLYMCRNFICGLSNVIITTFSQSVSACNVELCLQRPVWNRGIHRQQSNHQGRAAVQEVIVGICWIWTCNFRRPAMIGGCIQWQHAIVAHTQPFNAPSFGTTRVAWYQK